MGTPEERRQVMADLLARREKKLAGRESTEQPSNVTPEITDAYIRGAKWAKALLDAGELSYDVRNTVYGWVNSGCGPSEPAFVQAVDFVCDEAFKKEFLNVSRKTVLFVIDVLKRHGYADSLALTELENLL